MLALRAKPLYVQRLACRLSARPSDACTFPMQAALRMRPHTLPCSIQKASYRQLYRHTNHPRQNPCHQYTTTTESTSFADPTRPDLFYHLVPSPSPYSSDVPAFALSFLRTPPLSRHSSTIIGWLPASSGGQQGEAGLNDFRENPKFRDILHEVIRIGLQEGIDDIWINGATQLQNGWMHIHDNRNIPALGRIGDPDDILASVLVRDGKIIPDTYQAMPSYRFCTADGLIQLTYGLAKKLHTVLEELAKTEEL